ncbi:MAG TPA: hypothetical protein PLV68_13990, partial [Ilumatobacteraceae bacterium]|nr:hypothetical protein [Ilumatobacteraceae bacterium]
MARAAGLLTTTGRVRPVAEQVARWDAVTHDDVRRVIDRVCTQPVTSVALGPVAANRLDLGIPSGR